MFDPFTKDKLMGILRWPVSSKDHLDYLQVLMDDVVTYGGLDAIARIETLISDYEDAKLEENQLRLSTQASMTKADVVEWNPKLTIAGARSKVLGIVGDLRAALGVSADPFGWDCECQSGTLRLRKG